MDLTTDDFKAMYLRPLKSIPNLPVVNVTQKAKDEPTSFNWADKGAVTAVKDQGRFVKNSNTLNISTSTKFILLCFILLFIAGL